MTRALPPHPAIAAQASAPHATTVVQRMEEGSRSRALSSWPDMERAFFDEGRKDRFAIGEMGHVTGKGWLYALIAQAIRNDVLADLQETIHWEEKIDPVIAVTEVSHNISGVNTWRVWLVGASIREPLGEYIENALQKLSGRLEAFAAATQATIVVIPCNAWGKECLGEAATQWGLGEGTVLHAEQQILAYMNKMKVQVVSKEIGVAHFLGPCSQETAGTGSQECKGELTSNGFGAAWLTKDSHFQEVRLSGYY